MSDTAIANALPNRTASIRPLPPLPSPQLTFAMATLMERRGARRGGGGDASRRRYPRMSMKLDAHYESEWRDMLFDEVELSLRAVFLPCRTGDAEGTRCTVRLATPGTTMIKIDGVVVSRAEVGRRGMAVQFAEMSEGDRSRLAALLVRCGGLGLIPQLAHRFDPWTRVEHPLLRRERRGRLR